MTVPAVNGTQGAWSAPATTPPKQTLDSEVFLQLLVTQLRAQDPSSPMNTNEMMAQTTQLASMEQLTALTNLQQEGFGLQMRSAAAALLGREITFSDGGTTVTGVASSVSFAGPVPAVTVGGRTVPLDSITAITADS